MLRSITVKNFIHFKKKQRLEFQNGPNFIFGANGSGKSAFFELIRRCLSKDINASESKIRDKTQPSYCLSKFESNSEFNQLFGDKYSKVKYVYCCLLYTPKQGQETSKQKFVVFECIDTDTNKDPANYENIDQCFVEGFETTVSEQSSKEILRLLKLLDTASDDDTIRELCNILSNKTTNAECETFLQKLTEKVVFTFGLRGIAALQWSRSPRIANDFKQENYEMAVERAEILNDLMDENKTNSDLEKIYFDMLTYPDKYVFFKKNDSEIRVKVYEKDFPLLKVPEGILEAKQFSLLLSCNGIGTLCLEEPDRGMHPQMIERMRDLVLREANDKVLIIISNNQAMVSPFSVTNAYVMRSLKTDKEYEHVAIKVIKDKSIDPYFCSDENKKKALFAKRVLFVEGELDEILVRGLFERILAQSQEIEENLKITLDCSDSEIQSLKCTVCTLQIIAMGGESDKASAFNFCKSIQTPYCFLLDKDAFISKEDYNKDFDKYCGVICNYEKQKNGDSLVERYRNEVSNIEGPGKGEEINTVDDVKRHLSEKFKCRAIKSNSLKKFNIEKEFTSTSDQTEMVTTLRENNIFIWKSGNLEDMINEYVMKDPVERIPKMKLKTEKHGLGLSFPLTKKTKSCLKDLNRNSVMEFVKMLLQDKDSEIMDFLKFLLTVTLED